ncbi:formylglycine-generating enzyme family protein [Spartinivicinus poritis]|uniref:SUMF1/EgtB/PvdO family nonheme iron enzyme n=1 Tax=Spartinivicinus poritis TaxID=2994640 RepID=A0ABT5U962_9GAMM|nr:SUMF1/EgtB/PvdO family nonheme iron enzyme [Spartinivicinus sp. A2-2]MDE1462720.1 SUMF1/EgtB/PvdO family nonheme iron enzyme [Spartinivicinus sp. A2-2]
MGIYSILFFWVWIILSTLNSTVLAKEYTPEELKQAVKELAERAEANMVLIKGGEFWMGDQDPNDPNISSSRKLSRVKHRVKLDDYLLDKFEVTIEDFNIFKQVNNIILSEEKYFKYVIQREPPKSPVKYVSWENADQYCHWVGTIISKKCRLPTEAEWEFAARSRGKDVKYATNDGTAKPGINVDFFTEKSYQPFAFPVEKFSPNSIGIYGMEGGRSEWVNDWYDEGYYKSSPVDNPKGPDKGVKKVYRGSDRNGDSNLIYLYRRYTNDINYSSRSIGFRCSCKVK